MVIRPISFRYKFTAHSLRSFEAQRTKNVRLLLSAEMPESKKQHALEYLSELGLIYPV
jgi:hypothetical protein